jgi:hypothetical protein
MQGGGSSTLKSLDCTSHEATRAGRESVGGFRHCAVIQKVDGSRSAPGRHGFAIDIKGLRTKS